MNMKRSLMQYGWILLSVTLLICGHAYCQEPLALMPRLEILTPGMERSIDITQEAPFPQGMSQFVVLLIGSGPFSISVTSTDVPEGNLMFLSGIGISSAGATPFFKRGYTDVSFSVGIQIGNDRHPYGMVLLSCWLAEPEQPSTYNLTVGF